MSHASDKHHPPLSDDRLDSNELDLSAEERDAFRLASESEEVRAALRASVRRREVLEDPRWDALMQGTLAAADREALRQLANESPETRDLWELAMAREQAGRAASALVGTKNSGVVPIRRVRKTLPWLAAAAALITVGTAVWRGRQTPPEPLAAFSMVVKGGESVTRSAAQDPNRPVYVLRGAKSSNAHSGRGTPFQITLTAGAPASGPATMQAFLVRFGAVIPLDLHQEIPDASKSIVIEGHRESLFPHVPEGSYELWIAVGRPGTIPTTPEDLLAQVNRPSKPFQVSRVRVRLEGPPDVDATPLFDVAYSGCKALVIPSGAKAGDAAVPECHVTAPPNASAPPPSVRVWVKKKPGATIRMYAFDKPFPLDSGATERDDGLDVIVPVTAPQGGISIEVEQGKDRGAFYLPVVTPEPIKELEDARGLFKKGQRDEARRLLEGLKTHGDDGVKARAYGAVGRFSIAEDNIDDAIRDLTEAVKFDRSAGRILDEVQDATALSAMFVTRRNDFSAGKRVLDELTPIAALVPDALFHVPYYAGNIDARTGDIRHALVQYEGALRWSSRLGHTRVQRDTMTVAAELYARIGRVKEARHLLAEVHERVQSETNQPDACRMAEVELAQGWIEQLAAMSGRKDEDWKDPTKFYEDAWAKPCSNGETRCIIKTNQALWALEHGSAEDVLRHLVDAKRENDTLGPNIEDWWKLTEGRALLKSAAGKKDAYERARDLLAAIALGNSGADVRVEAKTAYAEALDALGDVAARKAYREADAEVERYSQQIALGMGAGSFVVDQSRVTERRIDYLLRLAEKAPKEANSAMAEAMQAARASRARVLATLQRVQTLGTLSEGAKEGWIEAHGEYEAARRALEELAPDASDEQRGIAQRKAQKVLDEALARMGSTSNPTFSAPEADELLIVYHKLDNGHVAFAMTHEEVIRVKRIPTVDLDDPEVLSTALLEPWREEIASAKKLRIVAQGPLAKVDIHALPWNSKPLLATLLVTYGVDAGSSIESNTEKLDKALVMGDTLGDLPAATSEVAVVENALKKAGITKISPTNQTTAALRAQLSTDGLRLFHFAGHAQSSGLLSADAGAFQVVRGDLDGWESGLRMGNRSLFSVADIVTLPRVPPIVILSACESGVLFDSEGGAGIGLAQAFITKGSRLVVATMRPVRDELSVNIMTALYESSSFPKDIPEALRTAVLQYQLDKGWASFRVFTP